MLDRLADILWEKDLEESFLRLLLERGLGKLRRLTQATQEGGDE